MADNRTHVRRFPTPGLPQADKFGAYEFDFESLDALDLTGYLDELMRFEAEVISNAEQFQHDILSSLPKPPEILPTTSTVPIAAHPNTNPNNTEGE